MISLAHRLDLVKPSPTLAVAAQAEALRRQGDNIINLGGRRT